MNGNNNHIYPTEESKRFVALLLPIQNKLYAYINYHVPSKNDSDDILQEVIATLLNKFNEYREGTDFLRWAITVAKYKILSFGRDNNRRRILFNETDMDQIQIEVMSHVNSLDEEKERLKKCLKKLPDKQKTLLKLRYDNEMTYRQIAKQFNVSMQSVYKTIARIHETLLKCINKSSRFGESYGPQ